MTGGMRPKKAIGLGERLFGVCALLYSSTAFIRLLMSEDQYSAVGDEALASPVKRVIWPVTYMLAAYFLAKCGKPSLRILRRVPLLAILLSYIAASVLWSDSRSVSILSVGALVGNTLIGLYFGIRYGVGEFLRLLGWVYAIIVAGSFFARIAIGSQAMVDGFWAGFFTQRNALAMNAAIGLLVFAKLARGGPERRLWAGLAILSATLVLLSGSATCILVLFLLACAYVWYMFLERHVRSTSFQVALSVVIAFSSAAIFLAHWDGILSVLGRSPDLTGRTEIWGASLLLARDKPLFGYGYGGFWVFGGPAQAIWDAIGGDPANTSYAHNGYLQILLDTGVVGLGLLLALVASAFRKAWTYAAVTKDIWPLCFFAFMALYNLGEATYAVKNSLCWLLFVATLVHLARGLQAEGVEALRPRPASFRRAGILSGSAGSKVCLEARQR